MRARPILLVLTRSLTVTRDPTHPPSHVLNRVILGYDVSDRTPNISKSRVQQILGEGTGGSVVPFTVTSHVQRSICRRRD